MSYQRITPFAALGRPLEKQAFVQGMKDVGNGLWNAAAGKVNQRATQAAQGVNATTAGLGGLASGGFHGAGAAADKSWNSDQRSADREAARSTAGFSQAGAGLKSMGSAVGKYFSGIGNAVMGGGTTAPQPVGAPPAATAPTQVKPSTPGAIRSKTTTSPDGDWEGGTPMPTFGSNASQMQAAGVTSGQFIGGQLVRPGQPLSAHQKMVQGISTSMGNPPAAPQQPAPATPQQPDMNQFNQPGGWTTGPNGEIQPMQKQSAFAQLGKSAYANYQAMGQPLASGSAAPQPHANNTLGSRLSGLFGIDDNVADLPATRTPMPGPGSAVPTTAKPPSSVSPAEIAAAPKAIPVPSPTGFGAPKFPSSPTPGTPVGPKPAPSETPTAEHIAAFRKQTGSRFDPKSRMDMQNMRRLMGGAGTMDRKQYGTAQQLAGPQPTLAKTAFAQLEKEALAKGISKGLSWAGKGLSRAGTKAKRTAAANSLQGNGFSSLSEARQHAVGKPSGLASMAIDDAKTAVSSTGNTRKGVGRALSGHADTIDGSKGIQNTINYGAGAIAGGAGLVGAHSMGHSSGREEGITEGVDQGLDLGLQGAQSAQPADPGFMGRLGDLFTGRQQGPDAATMRQGLGTERDKLIQALLAR